MAVIRKKFKKGSLKYEASCDAMKAESVLGIAKDKGISSVPLDIKDLIYALGIKLVVKPLSDDHSGYLERRENGWVIAVNSLHHPKRQRFTMAHELGHFFLHKGLKSKFIDDRLFRNGDSNPMEKEANQFAGELLMPEQEFRNFVKNNSNKIEDLSKYFEVSAMAVRVRASQLGFKGHQL